MTKVILAATANFAFSSSLKDDLGCAFNWTKSECILETHRWLLPAIPTAKGSASDTFPGRRQRAAPLLSPPGPGERRRPATCVSHLSPVSPALPVLPDSQRARGPPREAGQAAAQVPLQAVLVEAVLRPHLASARLRRHARRPPGRSEAPRSAKESASQPPGCRARRLLLEHGVSREADTALSRRVWGGGPGKSPPRRFPEAAGAGHRRVAAMADPGRLERLERRVRELEDELAREKRGRGAARARIDTMSPEVTDSNPYRCAEPLRGLCPGAGDGEQGELWLGTVGLGEEGEAHGAGGGSDGWEYQGWGWLCSGSCAGGRCSVRSSGEMLSDFPSGGWQGWMSGLLCIILLYNTGGEREGGNLVSFSARLIVNGTGVGTT